jgi:D-threonate/D-erythronate kinase
LRGNIGVELAAVAEAFPGARVVYVPAYPRMGRTVRSGILHVDGVPVHLTEFARDPLNPIRESHIPTLVAAECVHVLDADTDEEVARVAEGLLQTDGVLLAAGPAPLAEAIAARIDVPRCPVSPFPQARRCLVVNGSLHPLSAQQATAMASDADWTVVSQSGGPGIGQKVRRLVDSFEALIVFGGDTAFEILQALECTVVRPIGEIVPGVPVSRARYGGRELIIMSKAGGFGPVDILAQMRSLL